MPMAQVEVAGRSYRLAGLTHDDRASIEYHLSPAQEIERALAGVDPADRSAMLAEAYACLLQSIDPPPGPAVLAAVTFLRVTHEWLVLSLVRGGLGRKKALRIVRQLSGDDLAAAILAAIGATGERIEQVESVEIAATRNLMAVGELFLQLAPAPAG
jgi:hypothetical protein